MPDATELDPLDWGLGELAQVRPPDRTAREAAADRAQQAELNDKHWRKEEATRSLLERLSSEACATGDWWSYEKAKRDLLEGSEEDIAALDAA
jgi:hypothetical protein